MRGNRWQRARRGRRGATWLGTPYHNCADVKGVGVDCGMLLVRVFVDTGLVAPFDPRPYPADWHLHRSEEKYLGFVFDRGKEVAAPQPGDVMVMRIGRCYSHGGIVTVPTPLTIIHAYFQAQRDIEEDITRSSRLVGPRPQAALLQLWAKANAMSGLFGGGSQPTTTPDYTGLQIQTAVNTLPMLIIWGMSKLAPNIVWYNDFQTYAAGGGGGGKGGVVGGGKYGGSSSNTTYSASMIMALGEGPIGGINQIWKNQSVYTMAGLGLSLFPGTTPQSVKLTFRGLSVQGARL